MRSTRSKTLTPRVLPPVALRAHPRPSGESPVQTRRQFVTAAGSFSAAAVFAPQSLANAARLAHLSNAHGRFSEGLVSGDPTPNGITLWTRLADVGGPASVDLEVARDRAFR